jgi:hypothetical protein
MKNEERFHLLLADVKNETLSELHEAIRRALAEDDALPEGMMKKYGVREFGDFRAECRAIERILAERRVSFTPVRW